MAKILIVDDSEAILGVLQAQLRREGHETLTARGGWEALEHVAFDRPDLILSDVVMPEMDGLELCRRLQSSSESHSIPLILISSNDRTDEIAAGFAAGARDYISKPFEWPLVHARVRAVLETKLAQDELREMNRLMMEARQEAERVAADKQQLIERLSREVVERRSIETALRASEARFRSLFDKMIDGFALHEVILDDAGAPRDYRILEVNPAFERLTGLHAEQAVGRTIREIWPDVDREWIDIYGRVALSGEPVEFEKFSRELDKHFRVIAYSPERGRFAAVLVDISDRRRAEQALRENEERLRVILDSVQAGILLVDGETHVIVDANAAALRLMEADRADVVGHICHKHVCPAEQGKCPISDLREIVDNSERKLIKADGGTVPILKTVAPLLLNGRRHLLESFVDLSERVRSEEIVRRSEERFRTIFENANDAIFWATADNGVLINCNKAAEQLLGRTRDEIIGQPQTILHPPAKVEEYEALFFEQGVSQSSSNIDAEVVTKAGAVKAVNITASRTVIDDQQIVQGIFHDITERKRAEEALRESEERLHKVVGAAQDAIIMLNPEGNISMWNAAAVRIFGYAVEEALGRNLHELIAPRRYHADERRAFDEFRRSGRGAAVGRVLELSGLRKNGEEFPLELALSAVRMRDGWHGIGLIRDITQRKRAEAELLETNLQLEQATSRANHMALQAEMASIAKSEFLANMSHEIRTPMNGVVGMVELLQQTDLDPRQRRYLDLIDQSSDALLSLINGILDLSKVEAGKLELDSAEFSLRDFLEDVVGLYALRAQEKGVELVSRARRDAPVALIGDPVRLRQILVNLIGNAFKFTEHGEIVVRVEPVSSEGADVVLRFSVEDSGIGIPADKQALIFEPFAQADGSISRRYGGTGLGLTITARLVSAMGGRVWVESEVGRGSVFHFTVRLKRGNAAPRPPDLPLVPRDLPVLIVDDSAAARDALAELLGDWGLSTTVAGGIQEALEQARALLARSGSIPIVLLDSCLGEEDGLDVAEGLRRDPSLSAARIVLMYWIHRVNERRARELELVAEIGKPIRQSELLQALAAAAGTASLPRTVAVPSPTQGVRPPRPLRILLAEDNAVNQEVALALLEQDRHVVTVVNDGGEVLRELEHHPEGYFDLLLMDVQMPVLNGYDATAAVREREKVSGRHIPIIAMTAHAMHGDRETCLRAGMDDYISKPIRGGVLRQLIQHWSAPTSPAPAETLESGPETVRPSDLEQPVDISAAMENLDGNERIFRKVLQRFVENSPALCHTLRQAVSAGDAGQIRLMAHNLKGAAANVCAEPIRRAAARLEEMGKQDALEDAEKTLRDLECQLQRLAAYVCENLNQP